ncbi:hypothetical protein J6590_047465 [Homalodisca vitripennis]|nr:hypothetical protein J6590_047465 [Homalodisca vitripennis]
MEEDQKRSHDYSVYPDHLNVRNSFSALEKEAVNIDTAKFKTVKRRRKRRNSTKKTDKKNLQFGNCLSSSTTLSKTRFNISIFGDNHAKGLCYGHDQTLWKKDPVIIIGGNNDMGAKENNSLNHVGLSICFIDMICPINKEIKQTNSQLQRLQKEVVWIVDVSSLARRSFTRHGQHLNGCGKAALSRAWGREQDETLDDAVAADQQQTHLSRVLNDAGEDHSLLNATPEPTSVTLQFDSYADVVRSSSETVVER